MNFFLIRNRFKNNEKKVDAHGRNHYLCARAKAARSFPDGGGVSFKPKFNIEKMAILVKPIQRRNPQDEDAPKKWYVTQVTAAQVDETQVAMDLSEETTLNPSEAMMAIRQLRKVLLRHLLSGESVKLGNWGSFSVTITSTGSDTKEEVSARNIKSINLNFQPDAAFKADLQKASYAWVDKLAGGVSATDDTEEETPLPGGDDGEL